MVQLNLYNCWNSCKQNKNVRKHIHRYLAGLHTVRKICSFNLYSEWDNNDILGGKYPLINVYHCWPYGKGNVVDFPQSILGLC